MRFSKGVTFNTHDTSVSKGENGRISIDRDRGVMARCELCVNALLRTPKGMTTEMATSYLNKRLSANYNQNDIRHALNRLAGDGIISNRDGLYRAGKSTLVKWRKAKSSK